MNDKLEFKKYFHIESSKELILEICQLKDQSWPHGMIEQQNWINSNLGGQDFHIVGRNGEGLIVAYLNLVNKDIQLRDSVPVKIFGIGNVCVDARFKGFGFGSQIMIYTNNLLIEKEVPGVLLCKPNLVSFYNKLGWEDQVGSKYLGVEKVETHDHVMVYNLNRFSDTIHVLGEPF